MAFKFNLNLETIEGIEIGADIYRLKELDGTTRDKHLKSLGSRFTAPKGKTGQVMRDYDGLQASLVAACLFKIEGDGEIPVTVATIQGWPASVSSDLYNMAAGLCGMDEDKDTTPND